ncbi:MAG: NAD(P)-dependent oxidoreductase [Pseudanabaena sp. RU_4_16]|nr:NAD(P)-dependent oxidoreductase [Pseudanabaena sp. RU_4_16]
MKVGFLGTGLMGEPMVERLLSAQIPVIAYNRTGAKLATLQRSGVAIASSLEEAIAQSDCIILMLSDAQRSLRFMFQICKSQLAGRTIISMSTIRQRRACD